MNNSVLVYDLEIVKAIPPKKAEDREPDVAYCEGWDDKRNMGISVLCAYDYLDDRYRVFCEDNKEEFLELARRRKCLVSWNGVGFDNPVIDACWGTTIPSRMCYDLMREAKIACGFEGDVIMRGFRLDDWAAANLGGGKTGDGAMAPVDWQRGRYGSVIDYCLADVWLTKRLMDRVLACGILVQPRKDGRQQPAVSMRPPWSVVAA
jgi:DEAD/DEAH box helicase domain-containing protein